MAQGRKTGPTKGLKAGGRGRKFQAEMVDRYEFDPHELVMLSKAALLLDLLDEIEEEIPRQELVTENKVGGKEANPLIDQWARLTGRFQALVKDLRLPMDGGTAGKRPEDTNVHAVVGRNAATTRWHKEASIL